MKRRDFLSLSTVTAVWLLTGCGGGGSSSGAGLDSTAKAFNHPSFIDSD
jgi:hypothetical protein